MSAQWIGQLLLGPEPGLAMYTGTGGHSDPHAHHAVQLGVGIDEPLQVTIGSMSACDMPMMSESAKPTVVFDVLIAAVGMNDISTTPPPDGANMAAAPADTNAEAVTATPILIMGRFL